MDCFYHPSVAAVGTCKSCQKGLCPHCAVDLGKGLACRDRCEEEAAALIAYIQSNLDRAAISHQLIDSARVNRYVAPSFQILFGLVFLGFGAYQTTTNGFRSGDVLLYAMGGVFFIYGLYLLVRAVRIGRLTR